MPRGLGAIRPRANYTWLQDVKAAFGDRGPEALVLKGLGLGDPAAG